MQSQQNSTMFTVQGMRKFVCDRLTEAAQEILGAFEKRAQEYEFELSRQRRLLESVYSPGNACVSGPLMKEETNEVYITDIQRPTLSTRPQDVYGESQNSNPKEDENAAGKQQEVASASHQATQGSSHAQHSNTTLKTVMANKRDTPAKQVHKKCSHGYKLREGFMSKQSNASKNNKPVPSNNAPTAMEVIDLQDSSPASSDIELIQGDCEPATSPKVNRGLSNTACEETPNKINNSIAMSKECAEQLSQNKNSSNEAKSSQPQPLTPVLDNYQAGVAINMVYGTTVDSVGNTSSEILTATLNFPIEYSHPPDYEKNMTLRDNVNFVYQPFYENAIPDHKKDDKLLQEKDGKSTNEIPSQIKLPTSIVMESNNADNSNKSTFTDLDNVEKIWYKSTEQAIKDATSNTASTSFSESCMRQNTSSDVIDMQPMFTQKYEFNIAASSADREPSPVYGYEWKRPTQTKALSQEGQKSAFHCDTCGKVASNFKNYKSHVKSHTTEKRFKCETCGKMFRESWDLNKHQKIHSGEKPFLCPDCGKAFNRRFNLDLHKRVHTGEKPYSCGSCDKAFTSRVNLRKHERFHTGEKPYTCEHCQREFSDSSSFRNHQRVHTGEKPYTCSFCKKTFATRTTLKRHVRVHTGEKPYKCSICEKSFATNTDMKVHTRIHTGEKPYKCEYCGQEFSSWTNYNRHTNIHKPKVTEPVVQ